MLLMVVCPACNDYWYPNDQEWFSIKPGNESVARCPKCKTNWNITIEFDTDQEIERMANPTARTVSK